MPNLDSEERRAGRRTAFGATLSILLVAGCAGLPPGADAPRVESVALQNPDQTHIGAQFANAARDHGGTTAFRILNVGVDGFLTRVQMIDAAQRTLDLQYFILRGDETGRLITAALMRAADRGVRVRVLIDDGDVVSGDEQILSLLDHPLAEVRIFNPFVYRGHSTFRRDLEFLFNSRRLNYRMHNKLIVADNAVALIGGRNIGNQYFQMEPDLQFADDDVFTAGPTVQQLSKTFDEYWNSRLAIPAAALGGHDSSAPAPRRQLMQPLNSPGVDYVAKLNTQEPYTGMISGRLPLTWANAQVVCDSPDKKRVENGARRGRLMAEPIAKAAAAVKGELLMVTPYFVPAKDELQTLNTLLQSQVRVAILTNSLESAPALLAQSGYIHYRLPLLQAGANLYEIRSQLGNLRGSGQTARISRFGNYSLHAKMFIFDRQRLFIGSMNYDQRSQRLNTEVGLIIDSPALAGQMAARFENMTQPENAYVLTLRGSSVDKTAQLAWTTVENGNPVEYIEEPARSEWQRLKLKLLALLPVGREL